MSAIGTLEVEAFRASIARRLGLHFDDTKSGQLESVLGQRLEATHQPCDSYLQLLEREPLGEEAGALARALTVGETYFFRNPDHFRAVAEVVLPERRRAGTRRVRALSAGCSSGEEAYSLAILGRSQPPARACELEIRGVDVNPAALEKARRARFSAWALRETPAEIQQRWFQPAGREFLLDETLRGAVEFEQRNLAEEDGELWQPRRYDLIFCRNVLMYFVPEVAQAVVARMAGALVPGGYLFLGHAETLRGLSQQFHLCHTHGTFYYQLAASGRERLEPLPPAPARGAARLDPLPLPLVDASDGWVDAIRKAAERIQALSARSPTSEPPAAGPSWDLPGALELLRRERFGEALQLVRSFPSESASDPDVLLLQAVLLAHNAELGAAEQACHRLLALDELNAGAHYVLALCREGAGDRATAIEQDQVAVYLAPSFAMPRLHLGLLARRAGERETARRELEQALQLLQGEDPSRLLLFGGGFQREALIALCRAELAAVRSAR
ncbi:MAG TPA: protein-glutamate O-methyltransferase CheR [Polyangiaceae bacterium]|nr:protein-glutamate O-methyltransferase CheR [Polyangiaceae bacterium]